VHQLIPGRHFLGPLKELIEIFQLLTKPKLKLDEVESLPTSLASTIYLAGLQTFILQLGMPGILITKNADYKLL
jgi:hypothetical protein